MTTTARWVETVIGKTVVQTSPLVGGMSSRVERCELDDGSTIVVRTITDTAWLQREPNLIGNEVRALELVNGSAIRTPRIIAADPAAARLAMSFIEGSMVTDPARLRARTDAIASVAAAIASTPLPPDHGLAEWRSWAPPDLRPPAWGDRDLWRRGIGAFLATAEPRVDRLFLLHRDLHPLNLLWSETDDVGVVDWVNTCAGHPHAELGHLRWNLTVLAGLEVADRVLDTYLRLTPGVEVGTYHRWWDLAPLMSFLPGPVDPTGYHAVGRVELTPEAVVRRTEQFLAAALDAL